MHWRAKYVPYQNGPFVIGGDEQTHMSGSVSRRWEGGYAFSQLRFGIHQFKYAAFLQGQYASLNDFTDRRIKGCLTGVMIPVSFVYSVPGTWEAEGPIWQVFPEVPSNVITVEMG